MKTLAKNEYIKFLRKYSQYSNSDKWIEWYSKVCAYKGIRTANLLKEYKNTNSRLLDLGCGLGLTFSLVAQVFPNSIACDIDAQAMKAAKELLAKIGTKRSVIIYDGKYLPFPDNYFDIVTSIEVIEHVDDTDLMLSEIRRVLKRDGILHITTANKWWPYEPHYKLLFLSYLPTKIADFYVRFMGKGESYSNIKLPSYVTFRSLVRKYFDVTDITLSLIEDYKKYNFDKERGRKVVIVGKFLDALSVLDSRFGFEFSKLIRKVLLRVSLGWLFIARPKK